MTIYNKWKAHIVDLDILYAKWHSKYTETGKMTKRMREVHTTCIFALCLENGSSIRYAVGFQPEDQHDVTEICVDRLLDDAYPIRENDCDVVLVDVPEEGEVSVEHHRCQLTSFVYQEGTTEKDWVEFLKKKLLVGRDDNLRLVIDCEQEGWCNLQFLSAYLQAEATNCPYSQVFLLGQISNDPITWQCHQIYPELVELRPLELDRANALLRDRRRLNRLAGQ
jgi:hypothetical protein